MFTLEAPYVLAVKTGLPTNYILPLKAQDKGKEAQDWTLQKSTVESGAF